MTTIQIYICDKCGKEAKIGSEEYNKKPFLTVTLGVTAYNRASYNYFLSGKSMELCEDCLKKIGIVKREKTDPEPTQSIGDQLYDIVAELVEDAIANQ